MMIAYLVGIFISAGVTMYMLDRFMKKRAEKEKQRDEELEQDQAKDLMD